MKYLRIGLCYHPTTILLLDDNQDYLDQLQISFRPHFACLTFDQPKKALKYILEEHSMKSFIDRCAQFPLEETYNRFHSDFALKNIQNEANLPARFSEIVVIIVDYAMPEMNGLEFCKQIKNPNVFIILILT